MFGGQYDPDQVASAWQSVRGQMIDVMKNWQMVMTLDQSTGEMTIKADMPMPENIKMVMDFIVKTADNAVNVSGNWAMTNGEQEYKYELAMNLEKDSFWLNFPNKGTCRFVLSQNGFFLRAERIRYPRKHPRDHVSAGPGNRPPAVC